MLPIVSASFLTIGWRVTPTLEPSYWLDKTAKAGSQTPDHLLRIPADLAAHHTAIIAQSGSGKSFFLGRYIEELLVETRAACLVLDPNADFRRVRHVKHEELWTGAAYDVHRRSGQLPHEAVRSDFTGLWNNVRINVQTTALDDPESHVALNLWWPSISVDFLSEDADGNLRSQIYHCHMFVGAIAELMAVKFFGDEESHDVLDESEELFKKLMGNSAEHIRAVLEETFNPKIILKDSAKLQKIPGSPNKYRRVYYQWLIERNIDRALTAPKYVTDDGRRFYWSRAHEYKAARILTTDVDNRPSPGGKRTARLEILDLPSLPDKATRLLAINAMLSAEWTRVRASWSRALNDLEANDTRVPTFIVVDEAHNLIPREPQSKAEFALRDQFRTIVAEGRKYGLFLLLASQRPDKLDPMVLSECENKAVMKIGSRSVLDITRKMMGLEDVPAKLLDKCLEFDIGRVLLAGSWAPGDAQFLYAAARRTEEGGRNLQTSYWAARG
jgi:hypothetical protein